VYIPPYMPVCRCTLGVHTRLVPPDVAADGAQNGPEVAEMSLLARG